MEAHESETIPGRFETIARHFSDREAVRAPEGSLTYGDLNRAANETACHLLGLDLGTDDPIPIVPGRVTSTLVALLGILAAGRTSVCLEPSWPLARLHDVLARLESDLLMSDSSRVSLVRELTSGTMRCLLVEEATGETESRGPAPGASPDAPACIIFTSGSTGAPNGVIQSHRNMVQYVAEQTRALGLSDRDRMPLLFPMSSMAGLMASLRALLNGATLVAYDMAGAGVEGLPEWVDREGLTLFHSSPSVFRQMGISAQGQSRFATIERVYLSGEPATGPDVELFGELFPSTCVLYNNLGCTEVSSFRRLRIAHGTRMPRGTVPVGHAIDGKEVSLLDEAGNEVEPGAVGEICVRSRHISAGYWRDEELTRKRFPADPGGDHGSRRYLTGDLGRLRPDGCLEYLGRKDHQVKIRGHRVETESVGAALRSLPQVEDAVVVSHSRSGVESTLVAYVVAAEGARPTTSRLRLELSAVLPDSMVPARFVIVGSLPRLPGGKVDRASLPNPDSTRPELDTPLVLPRTPLEKQLAEAWAQVLGVDQVGSTDQFLELGGDSLIAVRLVSQAERVTGFDIPVESLGEITTVQAMASMMNREGNGRSGGELVADEGSFREYRRRMVAAAAGSSLSLVRKGSTIALINPEGSREPLFWCFNDYDVEMSELGRALGRDQPIFGLFSGSGVAPGSEGFIGYLAEQYAEEIASLQPSEALLIGGNCRGARVAYELAELLRAGGREVAGLCLLEFFDHRLFVEPGRMMLIYGRESHRRAHAPIRWGEKDWEKAFANPPEVAWVPGEHGEFFAPPNIGHLAAKVREFLG